MWSPSADRWEGGGEPLVGLVSPKIKSDDQRLSKIAHPAILDVSSTDLLLPDASTLLELLARAEQLLEVITACEQDAAEDVEESQSWRLPVPLADGVATSAISRVVSAAHARLTPAGFPARRPRLFAAARRYEHLPLRRVPLAADDADALAAGARVCHSRR